MWCVFFSASINSHAKPPEIIANKAIQALQKFDFQKADSLCNAMEQVSSGYLTYLTRANYLWWQIVTQAPDEELEQRYLASLDKAYEAIQIKINSEYNHEDLFYFINIFALKARLNVKNKEYIRAIRHLRNSIGYIEESFGKEPQNPNLYLTSGLYNYVADFGAVKYPFLRFYTILYPKGDMQKGLLQLIRASEYNDMVVQTEAHYFLMKIYLELEPDFENAIVHAKWLVDHYPENLLYWFYFYQVYELKDDWVELYRIRLYYLETLERNQHLSAAQKDFLMDMLVSSGK